MNARNVRWSLAIAGVALLAGCANGSGFNPALTVGLGTGWNWGGIGGGVTVPLGGGTPSVGVGVGTGGHIGDVGVGVGLGGSVPLGTPQPRTVPVNQPPTQLPQPAGAPVATPADWSPVQGTGPAVPAAAVNQAPPGSAFRDWPWGVQVVPAR